MSTSDQTSFQAPRGTRDFYPEDMLRRRWTENLWREISTRHGFEEIDGPRFEHLDLYTVKSGDGIVSELFSFARQGSETTLALRPEFTPTLARMVAAKASSLPRPVKWFSVGPYFRAERPQRGRLREFLQWNVDIVGDDSPLRRRRAHRVLCRSPRRLRAHPKARPHPHLRPRHRLPAARSRGRCQGQPHRRPRAPRQTRETRPARTRKPGPRDRARPRRLR